jgi:hypothetical protein
VSCCCETLVAEVGGSSGTQREGNVRRWMPLPSNGREHETVATRERERERVCVCHSELEGAVIRCVLKSPINSVINLQPVFTH